MSSKEGKVGKEELLVDHKGSARGFVRPQTRSNSTTVSYSVTTDNAQRLFRWMLHLLVRPYTVTSSLIKMSVPMAALHTNGAHRNMSSHTLTGLKRWSCADNDDLPSTKPFECAPNTMRVFQVID